MSSAKSLYIIYTISFIDLFAIGLTFPLFGSHLRQLGASHFTIGLISSLYSGTQIISGPVIGSWSDVRDRKFVFAVTLAFCSLSYFFLGITSSLIFIILLRFILGLFKHTQSICKAILTDLLPLSEQSGAFGRSAAISSIGFILGPILGGHLSEYGSGFFYVTVLTCLLFIFNIGLIYLLPQPINKISKKNDENSASQSRGNNNNQWDDIKIEVYKSFYQLKEVNWASLWDVFLIRFIFGLSLRTYFSEESLYIRETFNLSQLHVGYSISYFSAIGTISALVLHNVNKYFYSDDHNCLKRLTHFYVLQTVSTFFLYLSPNIIVFLIFLIPFSFTCSVLRVISMELAFKRGENMHRGSLSGVSNSVMSVSRFVGPVFTGFIADSTNDPRSIMILLMVLSLSGTILAYAMKLRDQLSESKNK